MIACRCSSVNVRHNSLEGVRRRQTVTSPGLFGLVVSAQAVPQRRRRSYGGFPAEAGNRCAGVCRLVEDDLRFVLLAPSMVRTAAIPALMKWDVVAAGWLQRCSDLQSRDVSAASLSPSTTDCDTTYCPRAGRSRHGIHRPDHVHVDDSVIRLRSDTDTVRDMLLLPNNPCLHPEKNQTQIMATSGDP